MGKLCLALLAVFFLAGPSYGQGADYEIRIFRPSKAGDRYQLAATGRHTRQLVVRRGDAPLRSQRDGFSVELTGAVEVLEADGQGNVVRASVRVDSLVRVDGLRRDELLPAATVVIEQRGASRQRFEIGGRPAIPELKEMLDLVLSETNDPGAPRDDELVGTRERKKVGERWPVNRERIARFFSEDSEISLAVNPRDVSGEGVLAAAPRVEGIDCLRVDVAFSLTGLPRNAKVLGPDPARARIDVRLSGLYPVDARLDQLEESAQLTMSMTATTAPAAEGRPAEELVTTWEQRTDRRMRPVR